MQLSREFVGHGENLVETEHPHNYQFIIKRADAFEKIRDYFRRSIHSKNATIFIAEFEGTIAGYCLITLKKTILIFKIEKMGYVSDLFVKEEFRGKEVSSKLKEEAFRWFREKGITHTSICVDPYNDQALSIYRKWGYREFMVEMRMKIE